MTHLELVSYRGADSRWANEEVRVAGVVRHPNGVDGGDTAENQRKLGLGKRRGSRHEADVAHRGVSAKCDVEEGRRDSTGEDAALQWRTPCVRNVEDCLVYNILSREARG
jgi:hypothetical protein